MKTESEYWNVKRVYTTFSREFSRFYEKSKSVRCYKLPVLFSRHNRNCVVVVFKSVGFVVVVLIHSMCIAVFITVSSVSPPANLVPRSLVDEPGSTTNLGTTHLT